MNKLLAACSLLLLAGACEPTSHQPPGKSGEYENFNRFEAHVARQASVLGKKYGLKTCEFDVECIYQASDLSALVGRLLALGGFPHRLLGEGRDGGKKQYVSWWQVAGQRYEFRTSSEDDYVELETVLPELERVAARHAPGYEYRLSNQNGGQIAILLFAKSTALAAAVAEGYPCSLPGSAWHWENRWPEGVYSEIKLSRLPGFKHLETDYYQTLHELYEQGYDVPRLTRPRLYVTDLFKSGAVDILLDGGPDTQSSNDVVGTQVNCFWDGWGVLLAYTLVKHYGGQPALYNKALRTRVSLSPPQYLRRAELAFGRRH